VTRDEAWAKATGELANVIVPQVVGRFPGRALLDVLAEVMALPDVVALAERLAEKFLRERSEGGLGCPPAARQSAAVAHAADSGRSARVPGRPRRPSPPFKLSRAARAEVRALFEAELEQEADADAHLVEPREPEAAIAAAMDTALESLRAVAVAEAGSERHLDAGL
jgi:hypothetical protein